MEKVYYELLIYNDDDFQKGINFVLKWGIWGIFEHFGC